MSIAHNLAQSGVREIAVDDFAAAIRTCLAGEEPALPFEEAGKVLDKFFTEMENKRAAEQAEIGQVMKKEGEEGVKVLPSGLQYKVIREGQGRKPGRTDSVSCNYEGRFTNGQVFDSSYKRGMPAEFGVNQVIAGWTEALQLMSEGSEWELYIPYQLAYGEAGAPGAIPPCSALIFKVELIKVL